VTIVEMKKARQAFDKSKLDYRQAQIKLQKTGLELLKNASLVTVVDAKKFRSEDGRYIISITLRNDSDLDKARIAMEHEDVRTDKQLAALLDIENVIVTIVGKVASISKESDRMIQSTEAIIGDPYQRIVPLLQLGEKVKLEYELLKKDVEAVTVHVEYLGVKREYPVFLKKEASHGLPTITSTQYAQQGLLGSKIRYDLELEALGKQDKSFSLAVLNLPPQIPFAFLDPRTNARVTQVKFTDQITKQSLDLEISIPAKLDQSMVDSNIDFEVFVTQPKELRAINDIRRQHPDQRVPAEALAKIKGNRVEMILIPKGAGKLEILIANQYKKVSQIDPVAFKFTILNAGTLALRQVTPEIDLPLEWEGQLEPVVVQVVEPGMKVIFTASLEPPADVAVGEYTIKVSAEGSSGVETVEGIDQNFTVHIQASRQVGGTLALVFILILLVVILAVATVKISRR